jgi:hypothetical protein
MSLLEIWKVSKEEFAKKQIQQIIAVAGTGKLTDGGDASNEFREFLAYLPPDLLDRYAGECLSASFENSGFALQDIVNEVGRRLGLKVENGRYRGKALTPGHDGLWHTPDGHVIVTEVKTTDTYRIDLETLASYRQELARAGMLSLDRSSALIVVGRQDTGDLEAQVRGSRHAWDIRLISVDALLRLMRVRAELEDPGTMRQIAGVLMPQEFTRLDGIIDLVFSTTEEVQEGGTKAGDEEEEEEDDVGQDRKRKHPITGKVNDACADRVAAHLKQPLIKQSRATYASPESGLVVMCTISKEYTNGGLHYWYALHAYQRTNLASAKRAYVALGCGSDEAILLVPFADFEKWLEGMSITKKEDKCFWHVHIYNENGKYMLRLKPGYASVDLTRYRIS